MTGKQQTQVLMLAVAPFLAVRPSAPVRCMQAFLLVAQHPGESVTGLARLSRQAVSTMSRTLLDLGDHTRTGKPGMKLIRSTYNPAHAGAASYRLTERGYALLGKMIEAIN